MNVLVVIPAYNEAANICAAVESVVRAGYDYVVVDDGSTDGTGALCRERGYNVISLSRNLGIGGAVQMGHLYAREHGFDVDVQFDGDGQHDVACIPALLEQIEAGADLVIGSRFVEERDGQFRSTFMRRVGIRWLQAWIGLFAREHVTDATSGFRACSARAIELFCRYYPSDYPEPESIVLAANAGLQVAETSVVMHERQGGSSSIGALSGAYYMLKVSLAIAIVGFARRKKVSA